MLTAGSPGKEVAAQDAARLRIAFRGYAPIPRSGHPHTVALMTISISDCTGDDANRSRARVSLGEELADLRDGVRAVWLEQALRELRRLSRNPWRARLPQPRSPGRYTKSSAGRRKPGRPTPTKHDDRPLP